MAGVRVLDLSRLLPGPYASLLLADLGATVVKVEEPGRGDYARAFPPLAADGNSAVFHALNRGKQSVALDLKSQQGRTALLHMLQDADVLLESFRPGVMAKLGLAPPDLCQRFPRLVVCSISGYGQDGPLRLRAGHDINYAARAGILGMSNPPATPPVQVGDMLGGAWSAALQVLAALYRRDAQGSGTGRGCWLDVSMTDGCASALVMPLAVASFTQQPIGAGRDMLNNGIPAYGVYATKRGHLAVGALEPKFWVAFVTAIGAPDLAKRGWDTGKRGDAVRQHVSRVLARKTAREWMALLEAAHVDACIEVVEAPGNALRDSQLVSRGAFIPVFVPGDATPLSVPRPPLSLTALDVSPSQAPGPKLGQHNRVYLPRAKL